MYSSSNPDLSSSNLTLNSSTDPLALTISHVASTEAVFVTPLPIQAGERAAPDGLLDKLTVTCRLDFPGVAAVDLGWLRERLAAEGIIGGAQAWTSEITFKSAATASQPPLSVGGRLSLSASPAGSVTAGGQTRLDLNMLGLLRDQIGAAPGPTLDGRRNVLGRVEAERPPLLRVQLATAADLVEQFRRACERAACSQVEMQLWARAAELNRDLPRRAAVDLAHRLANEPSPWHRVSWARHYAAPADLHVDGHCVTVTWRNDREDAPVRMKFYAKTPDLLRVEVCFDNREAVRLGLGWGGQARSDGDCADGPALASALEALARGAAPLLDAMEAHVARLDEPQRTVLELLAALAPLMRAGASPPRRRPGPRPSDRTRAEVQGALYYLLVLGRYDASGLRSNGTVRIALRRIADEGGLLREPRGRAALFTVPPWFSDERAALARALFPAAE